MREVLNLISVSILPLIIAIILIFGFIKKVPVYETFTQGAKEGIKISVQIIPYLVAIMAAVSMFRASGAIEALASLLSRPLCFIFLFWGNRGDKIQACSFNRNFSGYCWNYCSSSYLRMAVFIDNLKPLLKL